MKNSQNEEDLSSLSRSSNQHSIFSLSLAWPLTTVRFTRNHRQTANTHDNSPTTLNLTLVFRSFIFCALFSACRVEFSFSTFIRFASSSSVARLVRSTVRLFSITLILTFSFFFLFLFFFLAPPSRAPTQLWPLPRRTPQHTKGKHSIYLYCY